MSVVLGFIILSMALFIAYMAYRLWKRRKPLIIAVLCLQLTAITIAMSCFIFDVVIFSTPLLEAFLIAAGILLPGVFLVCDYINLINNIKTQGVYKGLVEAVPRGKSEIKAMPGLKGDINPPAGEYPVSELLKSLRINEDELVRNIRKSLNKAQYCLNRSDHKGAMDIYAALTILISDWPDLYFNGAGVALRIGDYEKAVDYLKKAMRQINSETMPLKKLSDYYYNHGISQFMLESFEQAAEDFRRAVELSPENEAAVENLCLTLLALEKKHEACKVYREARHVSTNSPRYHFMLGRLYFEAEEYDQASVQMMECLKFDPSFNEARELLAYCLTKAGRLDEAIEAYKMLENEGDSDHSFYYNLGVTYYKGGYRDKAIESFRKAVSLNPDSYRSYYNLAVALDESGNANEAIIAFRKVISLKEDFVEAYNNLGILLSNQNRYREALEVYRKGLEINPDEYSLYYNMGITLSECMDFREAEKAYKMALKLKPDEYGIYYYLGAVLVQQHKYNEAVETYKKAMKVQPDDSEIYYSISVVYSLLQKSDIALDNLRKAIELNSELKTDARINRAFEDMRSNAEFRALVS